MPSALSAPLSLSPSYPALTGEAGSRNTGDPSPAGIAMCRFRTAHRRGGDRRTLEE